MSPVDLLLFRVSPLSFTRRLLFPTAVVAGTEGDRRYFIEAVDAERVSLGADR